MRWFKHLSTSHNDEALCALVAETGLQGYGFWWMTLELLAENSQNDTFSVTYPEHFLRRFYGLDVRVMKKLFGSLKKCSLLAVEVENGFYTLACPNLAKYRDEYTHKVVAKKAKVSGHCPDSVGTLSSSETETETETETEKERPPIAPRGGASVGDTEIGNPPADEQAEAPEKKKPLRKRKPLDVTTPYSSAFDEAWSAYPVSGRKGKGAAFRAWERYRLAGRLPDMATFTASVRAHEEHDEKWRNGYVPNMATYLNQARWEDAIEAPTEDSAEPPPLMPFDHPDILECQAKMRAGELPLLTEVIAEMAGKKTLANMDAERKRRNDEFMAKYGLTRAGAASSD